MRDDAARLQGRGNSPNLEMHPNLPSLSLLAAVAILGPLCGQCVTAGGQTIALSPTLPGQVGPIGPDDEGLSAPIPLGFAFPIGGAAYTHAVVESNGVIYLTNGGQPVGATVQGLADMSGSVGSSPRIAAFWTDLAASVTGPFGVTWNVTADASVPGRMIIRWIGVSESVWLCPSNLDAQAVLDVSGAVELSSRLGGGMQFFCQPVTIGISAAGALVAAGSDLSTGPTSSVAALYEEWAFGLPDVVGTTTMFLPQAGGYVAVRTCMAARHDVVGDGCGGLTLSASPEPVSTPTSGATVDYVVSNMPESAPGSGAYVGLLAFSLAAAPAAPIDLSPFGAPGCYQHIAGIDVGVTLVGAASSQQCAIVLPPALPPGLLLYAQAAGIWGQPIAGPQSIGLVTSNAIASSVNAF